MKQAIKGWLAESFLKLNGLLPLGLARSLGRLIGRAYGYANGMGVRITHRNLELAYPRLSSEERALLAKKSLCSLGELICESGPVWLKPWEQIQNWIEGVEGAEQITQAQKAGRGVVVLVPHLGNWEVVGLHLATLGTVVSLYEPPKLKRLDSLIKKARQKTGATLVPTDKRGVSTLLKNLRSGGISAILPDQVPKQFTAGRNVPFFGVPCFTPALATNLIQKTGALALYALAERTQTGFKIHYLPADPEIYAEDPDRVLRSLNTGVERCIEHAPDQYQWQYKRFRTRSPDPDYPHQHHYEGI